VAEFLVINRRFSGPSFKEGVGMSKWCSLS